MAIVSRIPQTNIRLKHLIKVYSFRSDGPIPLIRNGDDLLNLELLNRVNRDSKLIGTIQSLTITSSRSNNFYRTMNFDHLGKIQEVYPGLPSFNGSVSNVALFKQHLVDAFQASTTDYFSGSSEQSDPIAPCFNIYNQISPLIIKVDILAPSKTTQNQPTDETRSMILWDVWFDRSQLEFDVSSSDDLAMIQEANIKFAWLVVNGAS